MKKVLIMQAAIYITVQIALLVKQTNQYQWKNIYKKQVRKKHANKFWVWEHSLSRSYLQAQGDLELGVFLPQLPKC